MTLPDPAPAVEAARSLLFVPGDRPERFEKAAGSGSDIVIIDLEDAVPVERKAVALGHAVSWLRGGRSAVVRINGVGTATHDAEVATLADVAATVMLPKTASAADVDHVQSRLGGPGLVALLETARGMRDVDQIAEAAGVLRLALGTIDLAVELGVDPASQLAFSYARSRLVLASAAAGLPGPVDGVTTDLTDLTGLEADLVAARHIGMSGKLCIHPQQAQPANAAFRPTPAELAWARNILDHVRDGVADGAEQAGVMLIDGAMVDLPVLARAQRIWSKRERADG